MKGREGGKEGVERKINDIRKDFQKKVGAKKKEKLLKLEAINFYYNIYIQLRILNRGSS